ncbi:uncharacterized protein C21orf58 homolog isoform X2 [Pogona vitticeps]|uniref:Uncharacterized protein C21orf58 homolog isoform X2 n=1 Tax=Pogona vitticeps TaxID=103695 RepID=A0ABM5EID9_9SAUR
MLYSLLFDQPFAWEFATMTDSDVADHMTQLKFKLLKKKLENEYENSDDFEPSVSTTRNRGGHDYTLQSALRRQKDLLQQLRLPQQPATIIQQIPQHPPLITQIPPPQLYPASHPGSIKEDMVEMMLMQNAQMHQIIMQNMMLKSLPLPASSPVNGYGIPMLHYGQQFSAPVLVRPEKSRPSTVHHHLYTPSGVPSQIGFSMWPSVMPPGLGTQLGGFPSDVHNVAIPVTATHSVQTSGLLGLPPSL